MDPAQFQQFVDAITALTPQGGGGSKKFVEDMNKRLTEFNGTRFADWRFKLRTAVKASHQDISKDLDVAEGMDREIDIQNDFPNDVARRASP